MSMYVYIVKSSEPFPDTLAAVQDYKIRDELYGYIYSVNNNINNNKNNIC